MAGVDPAVDAVPRDVGDLVVGDGCVLGVQQQNAVSAGELHADVVDVVVLDGVAEVDLPVVRTHVRRVRIVGVAQRDPDAGDVGEGVALNEVVLAAVTERETGCAEMGEWTVPASVDTG